LFVSEKNSKFAGKNSKIMLPKEKNNQSASFNKGEYSNVAFVFSCPGQEEEKCGKPVAGSTGKNLEQILEHFRNEKPFQNYSSSRYDFRIVNAWDTVEYKKKTKRTQATVSEIKDSKNLARLKSELENITDYIICFGKKAEIAIEAIYHNSIKKPIIIKTIHISPNWLNQRGGLHKACNDISDTINKKILLSFLSLCLAINAFAATSYILTGTGNNRTLTITGTGAMPNYSNAASSVPWYSQRANIKYVVINSGVTSIGSFAFNGCSSLTSVNVLATTPPTITTNSFYYIASDAVFYVPCNSCRTTKQAQNGEH
jgi:uracil-DNA glycosylase